MRKQFIILGVVLAAIAALNLALSNYFWLQILTLTLIWAAAGIAWNIPATAGQISLGHAAFTGIGAYGFVFLATEYNLNVWLGMFLSMIVAAVVALIVGIPTFRLQGFYFTLATLALPLILMVLVIALWHPELTVPFRPDDRFASMQFAEPRSFGWLALIVFALVSILGIFIAESKIGRTLRSIKDNEILARSIGVKTLVWKLGAFCLSAAICAAIGVIWVNAILLVVVAEEVFGFGVSILLISVTFVGGIGRFWGPVVGAALLIPLAQLLTAEIGGRVPGAEAIVYGVALVVVALLMPRGIYPTVVDTIQRSRAGRSQAPARMDNVPDATAWAEVLASGDGAGEAGQVLEVTGVKKRYGGLTVLRDVSFEVASGARLGLIGPNGAGKTTLFNLLTGHAIPDGGKIVYRSEEISSFSPPARAKLGISRTFQVPQGFTSMTAAQNVEIAALGNGMHPAEADRATAAILQAVGLGERSDVLPESLTAYELKLLELARAGVSRPRLLLLDEPLAGLIEAERTRFFAALDLVVDEHTAVVVIEHSVKALLGFASELLALDGGRMIASGDPGEVVRDPQVIEAYLGSKYAAKYSLTDDQEGVTK